MRQRIREALEKIDTAHKAFDAIVWLAGIIVPIFVVRSSTLRYWMMGASFLGGAVGLYVTIRRWQDTPRNSCLRASVTHGLLALLPLLLLVFLLAVLKPEFVLLHDRLIQIREFLLRTDFLPDLLAAFFSFFTIWLVIGAITLHSKRLCP